MRDSSFGSSLTTTAIHNILGGKKFDKTTVGRWHGQIDDKKTFNLTTFLKGNSKDKYTGLSDEAISALIAFEHIERRTDKQATERLSRIFPDDKKITFEFVEVNILFWLSDLILFHLQDQYKNIAQVQQSLKRPAPIEGKSEVPAKKIKK